MQPIIYLAIAVGFTALLSSAALHKVADFTRFCAIVADYALLPRRWVTLVAALIPAVEAALAVGWLLAAGSRLVAATTALLLGAYALAMAINLVRGRVYISCGCGGEPEQPLSPWLVIRNLLLVAAALSALPGIARPPSGVDWLVASMALLPLGLSYVAVSQLVANAAVQKLWRSS